MARPMSPPPPLPSSSSSSAIARRAFRRAPPSIFIPSIFSSVGVENLYSPVHMADDHHFPAPSFTSYRHDDKKRRMPQCIAHRGYRAKYPENTLVAFEAAVKTGAHALETDVHITKDDVVVLSHDASLKRCFGVNKRVIDCTWDEVKDLRTLAKPPSPMPRLLDLLEYLAQPGLEEIWLLLDIKLDNDVDDIMRLLGSTLAAASPGASSVWRDRVILGVWAAKYLSFAAKYLPDYSITHIGISVRYARHFLEVPNASFNMLFPMLAGPGGRKFIREAQQKYHRQVYAWTVNAPDRMRWCIRNRLDGVITDDPARFLDVCRDFDDDDERKDSLLMLSWRSYYDVYRIWAWFTVTAWIFWNKYKPVADRSLIRRAVVSTETIEL